MRLALNARRRVDPTGTTGTRMRFAAELRGRLRVVMREVRKALVEQDVLAIERTPGAFLRLPDVPPGAAFQFRTTELKVQAFIDWLRELSDAGVLEITARDGLRVVGREAWERIYIRTAYQKGIADARAAAVRAGLVAPGASVVALFNRPFHADRVGLLYTRVFSDLQGITDEMDKQISRILAQGMADGRGPREIARQMSQAVDGIGRTRANVLARTEVIRAHAEATLNEFETLGVTDVVAEVELSTAGDDRVCPDCDSLSGHVYTIDDARGVIPVHPNCRCAWLPVVERRPIAA